MNASLMVTVVPGAAVALGLCLVVAGWRQVVVEPRLDIAVPSPGRAWRSVRGARPMSRLWAEARIGGWAEWRWAVALQAGLMTWYLSGWPVAGAAAWAGAIGLPALLRSGRTARAGIERAEAVEGWSRRLSDVLLTGVGLEQAVAATVATCPEAVRPAVTALAARLSAGWPTEAALRAFADDLDDATADLVVAALVLGSRRRGPGLARTLTALADSLAAEVAMRRQVEAERAKPRATARAVTVVIIGALVVGALNDDYLHPYGTATGQVVLGGLLAALAGALFTLHRLAALPRPPRLLIAASTAGEEGRA